jgi:hypothetical protein
MNYAAHYDRLIARARARVLVGYSESHHVVPKCLGGRDGPENRVRLTAAEHYVAHQLLVKMHPGHPGLVWAANAMTFGAAVIGGRAVNKRHSWLRERARAQRGPHSAEHRAKIAVAHRGKVKSPQHLAALRESKRGKVKGPHTAEARARMSAAQKVAVKSRDISYTRTDAYRAAAAERMQDVWRKRRAGAVPTPNIFGREKRP